MRLEKEVRLSLGHLRSQVKEGRKEGGSEKPQKAGLIFPVGDRHSA